MLGYKVRRGNKGTVDERGVYLRSKVMRGVHLR